MSAAFFPFLSSAKEMDPREFAGASERLVSSGADTRAHDATQGEEGCVNQDAHAHRETRARVLRQTLAPELSSSRRGRLRGASVEESALHRSRNLERDASVREKRERSVEGR